jgi:hypothetical protein
VNKVLVETTVSTHSESDLSQRVSYYTMQAGMRRVQAKLATSRFCEATTLVFCGESRRDFRISPPVEKLPCVNASR